MTINTALLDNLLATPSAMASINDQSHLRFRLNSSSHRIDYERSILADAEGDYVHHPPRPINSSSNRGMFFLITPSATASITTALDFDLITLAAESAEGKSIPADTEVYYSDSINLHNKHNNT